ncbi:hypothetical protein H4S02_000242 [Coemansia sp. RSA 2611]|nr:hypothetical protein H4S02_000242 [Coemansia sp. RSA 2611]
MAAIAATPRTLRASTMRQREQSVRKIQKKQPQKLNKKSQSKGLAPNTAPNRSGRVSPRKRKLAADGLPATQGRPPANLTPSKTSSATLHEDMSPDRPKRRRVGKPPTSTHDSAMAARASATTTSTAHNGHTNMVSNLASGIKAVQDEQELEAKCYVDEYVIPDVAGVFDAAWPISVTDRLCAAEYATTIHQRLEQFITPTVKPPAQAARGRVRSGRNVRRHCSQAAKALLRGSSTECGTQPAGTEAQLKDYSLLRRWVSLDSRLDGSDSMAAGAKEEICLWASAFIGFVADQLEVVATPKSHSAKPRRLIALNQLESAAAAANVDGCSCIDVAIATEVDSTSQVSESQIDGPCFKNAALSIGVKRFPSEQNRAYWQLAQRTHTLHSTQINRRFAWGLTVCGTHVRACLFGNDDILTSEVMDVATESGRKQFVTLLVNWAMCESQRLGYDSTIRYNGETGQWEIDVWDDESRVTHTYIHERTLFDTSSQFGRRTRCFIASAKENSGEQPVQKVLIKDAWAPTEFPGSEVVRDELSNLRTIRDKLGADDVLAGTYSHLEAGGVVQQMQTKQRTADDTTVSIFADIDSAVLEDVPDRIYRRVATTPVGEQLKSVRSVDELIVVVSDVMAAHTAIVRRCGILHRDLSTNNIMFCRDDDGMIRGLLIDFDNAVLQSDLHNEQRPDQIGTFPYMSIGNLEQSSVKRTALDDWESLIYILCWLGTIGINREDQTNVEIRSDLTICHWHDGSATNIAKAKRRTLQHSDLFGNEILACFAHPLLYANLARLILELRSQLFYNERLSSLAQGCIDFDPMYSSIRNAELRTHYLDCNIDTTVVDPFARRAEFADAIVDDLLRVVQKYRKAALERIKDAQISE